MEVNYKGNPLDPAIKPVIFEIVQLEDSVADVSIAAIGAKTISGTKQVTGLTSAINVSDYAKAAMLTNPLSENSAWSQIGRTADITVGETTARVANSMVSILSESPMLLSDLKERIISEGDTDEISISLSQGTVGDIEIDSPNCVGIKITGRNKDFIEEIAGIPVTYKVIPKCGVRLCWINKYGAIDYWTFELLQSKSLEVSKEKIYTANGWQVVYAEKEAKSKVATRNLADTTISTLSYILESPKVWNADTQEEIDVISSSANTYAIKEMSGLAVEFRPKLQ